jgi:hypothetical protein
MLDRIDRTNVTYSTNGIPVKVMPVQMVLNGGMRGMKKQIITIGRLIEKRSSRYAMQV